MHKSNTRRQPPQLDFKLEEGLDALVCGDCTEEEFVDGALDLFNSKSAASLISRIDQYYQRGQLPDPIFRSVKSKITQRVIERAIDEVDDVVTRDAHASAELTDTPSSDSALRAASDRVETRGEETGRPLGPPAPASEPTLPLGLVLKNRYTVQSRLGHGATTDVFKALDAFRVSSADADHHVALKMLHEPIDRRPELIEGLRLEFECMRKLTHPNIVKVYEFEQDETTAFYTMEVLEGERLSDLIKRSEKNPLPRSYAWAIVAAIGASLAHAHARGVIHGRVNPENVLITSSGELRVLNFGSSGAFEPATSAYASCELLEGHPADLRDDIFALACLACELLGGTHPFLGRRATEARELRIMAHRPRGMGIFEWRAIRPGLSWSREGRPAAIRQWLAALSLQPEPARLPPLDQAIHRRHAMRIQRIAVIAALAICAILGFSFFWRSIDRIADNMGSNAIETASVTPAPPTAPAPAANPNPADASLTPDDSEDAQEAAAQPQKVRTAPAAAGGAPHPTIKFTAKRYAFPPGTKFAEIHVWRSHAANDLSDFIWWTEDASARAGVDFVAQDRTTHPFSHGARSATIFVRLLPRTAGAHPTSFRVCAGKHNGDAANDVTCSAVLLPARG